VLARIAGRHAVKYKAGYKYRLEEPETFHLERPLPVAILTPYITVTTQGIMVLDDGYAWNGANVIPDFTWVLRGSAGHDAGYQLLRLGLLPADPWRDRFDRLLQQWCREDGAWAWQAAMVYQGVHRFGAGAADPSGENPVLTAP
jgi:hypothetical protein